MGKRGGNEWLKGKKMEFKKKESKNLFMAEVEGGGGGVEERWTGRQSERTKQEQS